MKNNLPQLLLAFFFFLIASNADAQNIGINNPAPDASAVLDISSTDKGLLVPRVALSATNLTAPVTAPATGLMVFNTVIAGVFPTMLLRLLFLEWDKLASFRYRQFE
ncbi:MAG: hypothetical protein IPL22_14115 [Bacteroidetes bacterium]|nr:hypothetical protein [Bacteroidota bacterium]